MCLNTFAYNDLLDLWESCTRGKYFALSWHKCARKVSVNLIAPVEFVSKTASVEVEIELNSIGRVMVRIVFYFCRPNAKYSQN